MSETEAEDRKKPIKLEKAAEDTGEFIGKGLRKAWNVTKSFGKGMVDAIDKTEEPNASKTCPHCSALASSDSNFCARCGTKLTEC